MRNGVLSRSENNVQICLVGNPENRRVRDFQTAAEGLGFDRPRCVGWLELLNDRDRALTRVADAELIRIDSPGEDDDVLHQLIHLGGGNGRLAFGEIGFLPQQYHGFCQALDWLSNLDMSFQNSPADIQVMFDKWSSHERFAATGIPRPATWLAPESPEALRDSRSAWCSANSGRLFLKPRYASSASGVCAYRWSHGREQLIAPIEIQRDRGAVRLYNSLRVRQYTSFENIDAILERLLPQGMIVERWIRKARGPNGQFDLRVLVIGGEARHLVVRQSHHPMTNLHLGNRRGSIDEVRDAFGENLLNACTRLAERATACFPNSLYAGVDILVPAKGEPLVCEINAFGDLLPNLTHRGETTYEAILNAPHPCGTS